jgi:DNA mismatch endonuclease (patch repair protein)
MADVYTRKERSALMAKIRGRDNASTEQVLARVLRSAGLQGWRRQRRLTGRTAAGERWQARPDFIFPASRTAVFVDGCFWHGCPEHGGRPKSNGAFWRRKFRANRERDRRDTRRLRRHGWRVIRLWEHELKPRVRARLTRKLLRLLGVSGQ